MPIYEFECEKCGSFEVFQSMAEEHRADCPTCGAKDARRMYSPFHMKVATDAEISQRLHGIPRQRIERSKELRADRANRKRDPKSEHDLVSNELRGPYTKRRITRGG